ncbi:Formamidase [Apiospora phragmitis]|uniref:Formamidase n=1 Tax=Apiospora phragmitis TaxID=2905665 RepID=A0ABR1X6B3_9PEZI
MAHPFHIHPGTKHFKWSRDLPPVLTVLSGAEISFDLHDGGNNQIRLDNAETALSSFDFTQADPGHGTVFIEGADPGDVPRVKFLELETADYGWTAIFPGFGILADEFADQLPALRMWDLRGAAGRGYLESASPSPPFLGTIGIAPAEGGDHPMVPPMLLTGGNLDTRHITRGSALYLPVQVAGALLSVGDGHAAQGDGEVCGTAVETPMRCRLRVTVEKGGGAGAKKSWCTHGPAIVMAPRETLGAVGGDGREFMAVGVDADLHEATRKAVRGVLAWLGAEKGMERAEAYMLASMAGSLKLTEVVDMPNYVVGFGIPLGIFVDQGDHSVRV